ncbi:MAG: hypothetical protein IT424_08840 [Pirellulales bacterium]|nr:hypothetical protein [Pirellulales bacterium]
MRQFSSKATFLYKRVFPIAWFGIVGLVAVVIVPVILAGRAPLFMLLPLAMMSLIGYVIMRLLLFDLVDAAYLDDHYIIIRNKGVEERIAIQDVVNVNATVMTNPERITLTLRTP